VLLNSSAHRDHPGVKIPNPNVHMEYGLMLAFKKHIIPLQRDGDALAVRGESHARHQAIASAE
jgi:hypothetical protein